MSVASYPRAELLAYIDESYNDHRYWIVALLCDDDGAAGLVEARVEPGP